MELTRRRLTLVGASGGALVVAAAVFGGTVLAQSGPHRGPNSANQAQFMADVAQHANISSATLTAAIQAAQKDAVASALTAKTITQAEANQLDQQIAAGKVPSGFGFDPAGMAEHFGLLQVTGLQTAVQNAFQSLVGESQQTLFQEAKTNNESITQALANHHTTQQAVSAAEVAAATPLVNAAVTAGTITQAQATNYLNMLQHGFGGPGFGGAPLAPHS